MSEAIKQFVFTHDGKNYACRVYVDNSMGNPWDEHDGHGPVRVVRARGIRNANKRPGEREMRSDGHTVWFYDWQAACALAKLDRWGCEGGRQPNESPAAYAARAVQQDFDRMRAWCNGDWQWIGVGIVRVDDDGEFSNDDSDYYQCALWGIESDGDYYRQCAVELVSELE